VRYERSGSADDKTYDEEEYNYDPLAQNAAYYPTEDVFYTGIMAGMAIPIGYYNADINRLGYYAEYSIAYDFRGYNRIKVDFGYMHVPSDDEGLRQTFLDENPNLPPAALVSTDYTGDRVFYISGGSTSEIFFEKWSLNLNPRVGLVFPRDGVLDIECDGSCITETQTFETDFGWMNGLAANARYRLTENLVINGSMLYWDGVFQLKTDPNDQFFAVTGMRTLNLGVGISYSIPY